MKVRDLYNTMDMWTRLKVVDLDGKEVYSGMMLGLDNGIKTEGSENLLFDENAEKVLNMDVAELKAVDEEDILITVMK